MKLFFTAIILIIFHFASAQNNTSGTLISSGDSVLFTDLKPVYKTFNSELCTANIDKIEYTKDEMVFYISIVNSDIRAVTQKFPKSIKQIFGNIN